MKYTLNCYGWGADFAANEITDEQVTNIEELLDEKDTTELTDIIPKIEELTEIDPFYGELLHISKALDNERMSIEVIDEDNNIIISFDITEISTIEDDSEFYEEIESYDLFPQDETNIMLVVNEFKGGLYYFEFESEEVPTKDDFTYQQNMVSTPESDWDIIDGIYFKGKKLEIVDELDNSGKSTQIEIYKH